MSKSERKRALDCPPLALLSRIDAQFPQLQQRDVSMFIARSPRVWNPACYIPIAGVVSSAMRTVDKQAAEMQAVVLAAISGWRANKTIFRFDVDLAAALFEQADDIELPIDVLLRMPYPCVYVAATQQVYGIESKGFFAFVEHDMNYGGMEFRFAWIIDDLQTLPGVIHIRPNGTISTGLQIAKDIIKSQLKESSEYDSYFDEWERNICPAVQRSIQLILYLCAENKDVSAPQPYTPAYAISGRTIPGVTGVDVGVRVGAAFRHAARLRGAPGSPAGYSVRSHARRGHWHHYWVGPLKGERKLILRWVAPLIVNPDADGDVEAVIRPVK